MTGTEQKACLLMEEIARLKRDAGRYRKLKAWLLDEGTTDVFTDEFFNDDIDFDTSIDRLPEINTVIDAAMEASQ